MIGTEQERDAIMAAVVAYGIAKADQMEAWETSTSTKADSYGNQAEQHLAAIRAVLTPPDDAVAIPRELAERAMGHIKRLGRRETEAGDDVASQSAYADAYLLRAVLQRGEATRDE